MRRAGLLLLLASAVALGQGRVSPSTLANGGTPCPWYDDALCGLSLLSLFPQGPTVTQMATGTAYTVRGVSLTDTRASSVYCTNSGGTLVLLSNNQPCAEKNGLRVEGAATNIDLRSQAPGTAPWTVANSASTTNNFATAPDGTATAGRGANGGVASGNFSQTVTLGVGAPTTLSFYAQATGTSSQLQFGAFDTTAAALLSGTASIQSGPGNISGTTLITVTGLSQTQWTRVVFTYTNGSNASIKSPIVYPDSQASTTSGAANLYWGFQTESGNIATSYIPTTSASVTRAADSTVAASTVASGHTPSWSADFVPVMGNLGSTQFVIQLENSGSDRWEMYLQGGGQLGCDYFNGSGFTTSTATVVTSGVKHHGRCFYDGAKLWTCIDGVCTSSTQAFTSSATSYTVAYGRDVANGGTPLFGWLSNVCVDPSYARCQ